jgi:hypothetical protein
LCKKCRKKSGVTHIKNTGHNLVPFPSTDKDKDEKETSEDSVEEIDIITCDSCSSQIFEEV